MGVLGGGWETLRYLGVGGALLSSSSSRIALVPRAFSLSSPNTDRLCRDSAGVWNELNISDPAETTAWTLPDDDDGTALRSPVPGVYEFELAELCLLRGSRDAGVTALSDSAKFILRGI